MQTTPGVIQIGLEHRRTFPKLAPLVQCTALCPRTQPQPGGHRALCPPQPRSTSRPGCHSDLLPLHLSRLPEPESPTRAVSHCSISQSIIHTTISACFEGEKGKKKKKRVRKDKGEGSRGLFSVQGIGIRALGAFSKEVPAFALLDEQKRWEVPSFPEASRRGSRRSA